MLDFFDLSPKLTNLGYHSGYVIGAHPTVSPVGRDDWQNINPYESETDRRYSPS